VRYKVFDQHITFKAIVLSLPADIKEEMIKRVKACSNALGTAASRAPNTTKHEVTRLIELRVHPAAQRLWFSCYSPQDRSSLDANHRSEDCLGNLGGARQRRIGGVKIR